MDRKSKVNIKMYLENTNRNNIQRDNKRLANIIQNTFFLYETEFILEISSYALFAANEKGFYRCTP